MKHKMRGIIVALRGMLVALAILLNVLVNIHLWGWADPAPPIWEWLSVVAGLALLGLFLIDRTERWVVIPAVVCLILAGIVSMNTDFGVQIGTADQIVAWAAPIGLVTAGLSSCVYYFSYRADWWALPLGTAFLVLAAEVVTAHISPILASVVYVIGLLLTAWVFMLSQFPRSIRRPPGKRQHTAGGS